MGQVGNKNHVFNIKSSQTDGQTEVTNKTLGTFLRTVIRKNLKSCEEMLPHVEFSCNRETHCSTNLSLFMCVE